jgi:3-dehydroquinate synthase
METTGVILAGGKGQRLVQLNVPKPLVLVFGKFLILYQIERMQEYGIKQIYIVADEYTDLIKTELKNCSTITSELFFTEKNKSDGIIEAINSILKIIKSDVIVSSCDLIFESNPFFNLKKKDDIEVLIDREIEKNQFCGSGMKIKTSFFSEKQFGDIENFNAFNAGIYYFSQAGLKTFGEVAAKTQSKDNLELVLNKLSQEKYLIATPINKMSWFDVNTPVTLMRAEMFLRSCGASNRQTNVSVDKLEQKIFFSSFHYEKSSTTDIILERGIINNIGKINLMTPGRTASRHIIITDSNVDPLYGDFVYGQFLSAGYQVQKFVVQIGETAKSMRVYNDLSEKIIALGIDEQSIIFALGGGVVSNLAGFLASTLYRGIGLIHIPTTIMNMLDVSVSLKQGINGQRGKNLVGSYYQPLMVIIDPSINIPDWLVCDGLSEVFKHVICQSRELYDFLINYEGNLNDIEFRTKIISETIDLKIKLMHEDMFENNRGMILQYGHEIGHAIEYLSSFGLTHGQAICIGMRVSAELSKIMNVASNETVEAHINIFKKYNMPYKIPATIEKSAIMESLRFNKKTRGKDVRVVLPEYIGKAWKIKGEYGIPCPIELIKKAVEKSY